MARVTTPAVVPEVLPSAFTTFPVNIVAMQVLQVMGLDILHRPLNDMLILSNHIPHKLGATSC